MENTSQPSANGRWILGIVFLVFTILLTVSFYNSNDLNRTASSQAPMPLANKGQNTNLDEVISIPDEYVGVPVTVRGQVDESIGTRGVKVESVGTFDKKLLVVSRHTLIGVGGGPGESIFKKNEKVQVTGTVQKFSIQEVEKQIGVDLDDSKYREYQGQPVIIAESITPISN